MNANANTAQSAEDQSAEDRPGEPDAPPPPPTAFHAFAERIGSRNLMIAIVSMPVFFLGVLVLIIALVGLPEDEPTAANASDAALDALGAPLADTETSFNAPDLASDLAGAEPVQAGAEAETVGAAAGGVAIPADASLGAMALDGDRLAVRIDTAEGPVIVIYDLARNVEIQRIPFTEE